MTKAFERSADLADEIVARLNAMFHEIPKPLALHEPQFDRDEWVLLKNCLDTGWVSTAGRYVEEFEHAICNACEVPFAIAVVNGTAALHVALSVAGVGPEDEVLMPSLTFVATAAAVRYCGAFPHFVDSDLQTLGLDPEALSARLASVAEPSSGGWRNRVTGRRIAAVVPVHVFGHPVDLDRLAEVAARFGLPLVEDAAEALGSQFKGRAVGSGGRLTTLSFNGNKIVTTGGGGAILTGDRELAARVRHLTTTARVPHQWSFIHDEVGYNYRLPNINAALGCAQLEQLPGFVAAKRSLALAYQTAFAGIDGVRIFREPAYASSNFWLNALLLEPEHAQQRDTLLECTNAAGIMTRPVWTLMHKLAMFRTHPRMERLDAAEEIERRLINIPSSAVLGMHRGGEPGHRSPGLRHPRRTL
jgi:perosamine synthetase